jgi:hypothetical protein
LRARLWVSLSYTENALVHQEVLSPRVAIP